MESAPLSFAYHNLTARNICWLAVYLALVAIPLTYLILKHKTAPREQGPKKPQTWRIQGISLGTTKEKLVSEICIDIQTQRGALATAVSDVEREILKVVLAQDGLTSLCATITTTLDLKLPQYAVDRKFHGMTPLYVPENAAVDIIAVSGLNGHAVGSFKAHNEWQIWLRDFLPEDIPNARIVVYGYDTALLNSLSKASVGDLAKTFLASLEAFRKQLKIGLRPIVFIAHSLGGLLVKQAIAIAQEDDKSSANFDIYRSTCAFAFFGVPNLGLRHEDLCQLVENQFNESLIKSLMVDSNGEPSSYLDQLSRNFRQACRYPAPKFKIVSFSESNATNTVQRAHDGSIRRTGPPRILVTSHSAAHASPDGEDPISLAADHSDLVKYHHRTDHAYRLVARQLDILVEYALRTIGPRYATTEDKQPDNPSRWQKSTPDCSGDSSVDQPIDKNILRSLAFPEIHFRRNDVKLSYKNTCKWILNSNEYVRWRSSSRDLLWIMGKPGAGKSTLMKFIYDDLKNARDEQQNTDIHISFFFSARGTELQWSRCGMFRSMLNQLLIQDPSGCQTLRKSYQEKMDSFGHLEGIWTWQEAELEALLLKCLKATAERRSVTVFVDALDESGNENAQKTAEFFHRLNDDAEFARLALKICISCRHFPIVHIRVDSIRIEVEQHNSQDIEAFIMDTLRVDHMREDHKAWQELKMELVDRAKGVFQWAILMVQLVQPCIDEFESIQVVRRYIDQVPPDLKDIYKFIVEKGFTARNRAQTFSLFQWVCLASRPLSLTELRYALSASSSSLLQGMPAHEGLHKPIETDAYMEGRLRSLSGGLVEIVHATSINDKDEKDRTVQIIHQSVKDFFVEEGFGLLVSMIHLDQSITSSNHKARLDEIIARCHASMYWSILHYISIQQYWYSYKWTAKLKKFTKNTGDRLRFLSLLENAPFIKYAMANILLHANRASIHRSQDLQAEVKALQELMPRWVTYNLIYPRDFFQPMSIPQEGMSVLHVAAEAGLSDIVAMFVKNGHDVNQRDQNGVTALHCAAKRGRVTAADVLLDAGADPSIEDKNHFSPLSNAAARVDVDMVKKFLARAIDFGPEVLCAAAERGSDSLTRILIEAGADVNLQGGRYGCALSAASYGGHDSTVQILFEHGADVNLQGGEYGCALSAASVHGHNSTVQILLKYGANVNLQGGRYGCALSAASVYGNSGVTKILLDHGADPKDFGRALRVAIQRRIDALQMGEQGSSILGTKKDYDDVIKLLVDRGAQIPAASESDDNEEDIEDEQGNEDDPKSHERNV